MLSKKTNNIFYLQEKVKINKIPIILNIMHIIIIIYVCFLHLLYVLLLIKKETKRSS